VLIKTGLLHLARDEFVECVRCLRAGMAANRSIAALNDDMQRIVDQAQALMSPNDEPAAGHLLLNAYAGQERPH
jgi:hypothetical protein